MNKQQSESQSPEFDHYASSYADLVDDPLRRRFANDALHFHRRKWSLMQRLLTHAGSDPSKQRWLDVGCGQGELLGLAADNFAEAHGCDPSAGMLASCESFLVKKQVSPMELPFEDGSMDFVTAVCVYHHVQPPDRPSLTKEIRRVLAPRGLCCIIEHNPWNPVTQIIVNRCPVDVDAKLLTARNTRRVLKDANFETISTRFFLYCPERWFPKFGHLERALERLPLGGQYAVLARALS